MLKDTIKSGINVKLCGSCMAARGLSQEEIVKGAEIGTMNDLVQWVDSCDKVLIF